MSLAFSMSNGTEISNGDCGICPYSNAIRGNIGVSLVVQWRSDALQVVTVPCGKRPSVDL